MPNLETLVWEDRFSLDSDFFQRITRSKAQHVKLNGTPLDEPWSLKPPLTPSSWPIRSLDLNVRLAFQSPVEDDERVNRSGMTHRMTSFFSTIFQLCSPTLESLAWTHRDFQPGSGPISLGDNPIRFPCLQRLQLGWLNLESHAISSFLSAPLRCLDLSESILACIETHFSLYELLRDIESLVIRYLPRDIRPCKRIAEFIIQHKDVHRLYIHEFDDVFESTAHLDRYIIPALASQDFSNLRSLSLAWGGGSTVEATKPHDVHIPDAALAMIGRLVSLEQLSLCAGISVGWRHQRLVNHEELRRHFAQLQRLRKLALVRDTYSIPLPGVDVEQYYDLRFVGNQESVDAKARPELDTNEGTCSTAQPEGEVCGEHDVTEVQLWERAHRNRMLEQAEKYAVVLARLEWVLCGQRPMGFRRTLERQTTPPKAVPLTEGRDECYTFLQTTFRGYNRDV